VQLSDAEEATMAVKKIAVAPVLKFKKEWILDPPPPFWKLDRATLVNITKLRDQFVKDINEMIQAGRR
jgi:hypothetical protein